MTYRQLIEMLSSLSPSELDQEILLETFDEVNRDYVYNKLYAYQIDLGAHGEPMDGQFVLTRDEVDLGD